MSPTSADLFSYADQCAARVDLPGELRQYPSFSEVEEQCEREYDELLAVLAEDEVFQPVDVERQEMLAKEIAEALPDDKRELIEELIDNLSRHMWMQQEAAYFVGLALGLRMADETGPEATAEAD